MNLDNVFRCDQGADRPWFFVPDTGTPGGTARLSGPLGDHEVTETQIGGAGVGFQVPIALTAAGDYTLTVTQDHVETVYEIDVLPAAAPGDPIEVVAAKERAIARWPKNRLPR